MTDPAPRKCLEIVIDDAGRDFIASAIDQGLAPNLAGALQAGTRFGVFYAAPLCSIARARLLTGLEAVRPGNYDGENVMPAVHVGGQPFNGRTGPWITHQMPGTKTMRGKVHLSGVGGWPGPLVGVNRFDAYSGSLGNLTGITAATNDYSWPKGTASSAGASVAPCTTFATNDTAADVQADLAAGVDFVRAHFNAVHAPLAPLPPANEPPGHTPTGVDPRMDYLQHLDYRLGAILAAAALGDYVVFLLCDNGTPGAGKGLVSELGLNTTFVVLGNGVAASASNRMVQATDLFATIRRLRGAPLLATPDSVDFTDAILPAWSASAAPRAFVTCASYL